MKVKKKPVIVDAIQITREILDEKSGEAIRKFCKGNTQAITRWPDRLDVHALGGDVKLEENDWLIKGVKGEFYPCKPDIFEQTYEILTEEDNES